VFRISNLRYDGKINVQLVKECTFWFLGFRKYSDYDRPKILGGGKKLNVDLSCVHDTS
jgi:hypothetical protein